MSRGIGCRALRAQFVHRDPHVGIPQADLPHIVERLYWADPSRARTTGGSGLGLTIAHELITAQHGTITVISHPGAGSRFTVTLPASKEAVELTHELRLGVPGDTIDTT
jgi:signal transduction histidine kinase